MPQGRTVHIPSGLAELLVDQKACVGFVEVHVFGRVESGLDEHLRLDALHGLRRLSFCLLGQLGIYRALFFGKAGAILSIQGGASRTLRLVGQACGLR